MKDNGGSHEDVRGKRVGLDASLTTCQGYDAQMLPICKTQLKGYGPALTTKKKEEAFGCQKSPDRPYNNHVTILHAIPEEQMRKFPKCRQILLVRDLSGTSEAKVLVKTVMGN